MTGPGPEYELRGRQTTPAHDRRVRTRDRMRALEDVATYLESRLELAPVSPELTERIRKQADAVWWAISVLDAALRGETT